MEDDDVDIFADPPPPITTDAGAGNKRFRLDESEGVTSASRDGLVISPVSNLGVNGSARERREPRQQLLDQEENEGEEIEERVKAPSESVSGGDRTPPAEDEPDPDTTQFYYALRGKILVSPPLAPSSSCRWIGPRPHRGRFPTRFG